MEQEHLNNVFGVRLRITTLRAATGTGVELLEYRAPRDGRPAPHDLRANDVAHWQITMNATGLERLLRPTRLFTLVSPDVTHDRCGARRVPLAACSFAIPMDTACAWSRNVWTTTAIQAIDNARMSRAMTLQPNAAASLEVRYGFSASRISSRCAITVLLARGLRRGRRCAGACTRASASRAPRSTTAR